jgi:hypothetical protein
MYFPVHNFEYSLDTEEVLVLALEEVSELAFSSRIPISSEASC